MPAARGNCMQLDHYLRFPKVSLSSRANKLVIPSEARDLGSPALRSRLAPCFGQRLQLVLIDLDLSRLLHLIAQAGPEQLENLLLLSLEQRFPDLVALGGEVPLHRSLHLQHRYHRTTALRVDGHADVSRLLWERNRRLSC